MFYFILALHGWLCELNRVVDPRFLFKVGITVIFPQICMSKKKLWNSLEEKVKYCQGFSELFVSTELPNDELTSVHTPHLSHLLL